MVSDEFMYQTYASDPVDPPDPVAMYLSLDARLRCLLASISTAGGIAMMVNFREWLTEPDRLAEAMKEVIDRTLIPPAKPSELRDPDAPR